MNTQYVIIEYQHKLNLTKTLYTQSVLQNNDLLNNTYIIIARMNNN